eukprot:160565_1
MTCRIEELTEKETRTRRFIIPRNPCLYQITFILFIHIHTSTTMPSTPHKPNLDGSGAIAIKMVHKDSKWTITADVVRLIFSISLLAFSTISVVYAIGTSATTVPGQFPVWTQYVALGISLFILAVLEGLQIAVVELAHNDPRQYAELYPRAAKLLAFENKGRNVERFLMGRQVLVVFTVFVAARITTFDAFFLDVPTSLIHVLMYSGFLGVILVVIVAQLTPQVLASAYPAEFLNLHGMNIAFWACLAVESTGLVHAVWFLCVTVRKLVYECVCAKSHYDEGFDEVGTVSYASITPLSMDTTNGAGGNMEVTNDMVNTAKQAEEDIEVELVAQQRYNREYQAVDDHVPDQLAALIQNVGSENRDLFYIYGDEKYMSPSQCYDKFLSAGLTPPQFLLPPDNDNHIPPHIVAMTLLKMYAEQEHQVYEQLQRNDA